jgi:hypothetical protein
MALEVSWRHVEITLAPSKGEAHTFGIRFAFCRARSVGCVFTAPVIGVCLGLVVSFDPQLDAALFSGIRPAKARATNVRAVRHDLGINMVKFYYQRILMVSEATGRLGNRKEEKTAIKE